MSQINFVSEFRAITDTCRRECIPGRARLLWIALFTLANDRAKISDDGDTWEWPDDFFPVSNSELEANCPLEKRAMLEARNRLKQLGVIDFRAGESQHKPAKYKLIYQTSGWRYKNVPPNVPPQVPPQVPRTAPQDVPFYINTEYKNNADKKGVYSHTSDQRRPSDARARLDDTYIDANGEEMPCRYDGAFQTSEKARAAVAQRILDGFFGDIDSENAHRRICTFLHDGMPPEIFEDEIGNYSTLSQFMADMACIFRERRYEERRDALEMNKCMRTAKGNAKMAKFLYKCSDRYHGEADEA